MGRRKKRPTQEEDGGGRIGMVEGGEEKETTAAAAALNQSPPSGNTESVSREEKQLGFRAAIFSQKQWNLKTWKCDSDRNRPRLCKCRRTGSRMSSSTLYWELFLQPRIDTDSAECCTSVAKRKQGSEPRRRRRWRQFRAIIRALKLWSASCA